MNVTELPSPETLANLVTRVTETMFGVSFGLQSGSESGTVPQQAWKAALLPIEGERQLTVAVAADPEGCRMMASAIFSCEQDAVDDEMIIDSLSELANIVAGQIKVAMAVDDALGLPRIVDTSDPLWSPPSTWRSATLSRGSVQTVVWVAVSESSL